MHKNKVIILAIGTVILIALSITMFYMERQSFTNISESGPEIPDSEKEENVGNSEEGSPSSTPEGNIDQSDNTGQVTEDTLGGDDQDTLREYAEEAINEINVTDESTELSQESLYKQSLLAHTYNLKLDEESIGSDNFEPEAEWISLELISWKDHAEENYSFTYSLDNFLEFLNQEEYLQEEEDEANLILLDELNNEDENLYHRQLEVQYLKPFIWASIESEIVPEANSENNEISQHFREFEQEIMEKLIEENPQLIDEVN